jgi:hypothetical protein
MPRASLAALLLACLAACSAPPDKERGQAEGAIAAARAASADVYAPTDLQAAEAALARYDAAVAQKDYRAALSAALDARDRAYEAVSRASTAKADARGKAEQLLQALDDLIQTGNRRLTGAIPPRISGVPGTRVRRAVATATTALQEARSEVETEKYPAAITRLEAAQTALQAAIEGAARR